MLFNAEEKTFNKDESLPETNNNVTIYKLYYIKEKSVFYISAFIKPLTDKRTKL